MSTCLAGDRMPIIGRRVGCCGHALGGSDASMRAIKGSRTRRVFMVWPRQWRKGSGGTSFKSYQQALPSQQTV